MRGQVREMQPFHIVLISDDNRVITIPNTMLTGSAALETRQREIFERFTGTLASLIAEELGINLLLGGHYATETFGVKALAAHLARRFNLPWLFLDYPTGL